MTILDKLILNKFHANEDDKQNSDPDCCYIGHLKNEPEACVAMTGRGTKMFRLTHISVTQITYQVSIWRFIIRSIFGKSKTYSDAIIVFSE